MKATHGAWIALAVLLLAGAGAATLVLSEPGGGPAPSREVASAAARDRSPAPLRVPRTAAAASTTDVADQPADAPSTTDPDTPVEAAPAQPEGNAREVKGVVVDRATGRPLAGARILFCHVADDGSTPQWHGDETDASGHFEIAFDEKDDLSRGRMEVRARKAGYEDLRRAPEAGDMRVALDARTHAPEPGRVVGLAVDPKSLACPGRLLVEAMDDFGSYQAQWTRADAAGTFVLEGMPPGYWRLRADHDEGRFVEVLVPERGEARVELCTPLPERDDPVLLKLEKLVADVSSLERDVDVTIDTPKVDAKRHAEESERFRAHVDALRARITPGRAVVVSGLRAADGAVVRLSPKTGRNWFWRARAEGAAVRFEDVPAGSYVLRLETPDGPTDAGAFELPAEGTGPLEVSVAAAK